MAAYVRGTTGMVLMAAAQWRYAAMDMAPVHGNGAKGHVTDWHHGWFDLIFTLPALSIFPHLYVRV